MRLWWRYKGNWFRQITSQFRVILPEYQYWKCPIQTFKHFLPSFIRDSSQSSQIRGSLAQVCTAISKIVSTYILIHHEIAVRSLFPLERTPGLISLLAGKPNPTTFPLTSIKLTSRSPTNPDEEIVTEVSGKALAEGLQYGPSDGIPDLLNWLYGLQERSHGRKRGEGWRISVGSGSQDVIYKVPSISHR